MQNHYKHLTSIGKWLLAASLFLILLTGCSSWIDSKDPSQLFRLSLSGVAGVDNFKFSGQTEIYGGNGVQIHEPIRFSGTVQNHKQTTFQAKTIHSGQLSSAERWNPLQKLQAVSRLKQNEIVRLPDQPQSSEIALQIKLNPEEAKELLSQHLMQEMDALSVMPTVQNIQPNLQPKQYRELQKELGEILKTGNEKLNQMLQHAKVEAVYTLWIDRTSLLPTRMAESTNTVYTYKSKAREEKIAMKAAFKDYR